MPQPPWTRVLATGRQFAPLRRVRHLTADLVAQTQRARRQLGTVIGELVETGRHRNEELGRIVRSRADRQFAGLGLVTKQDLVAFERRMRPAPAKQTLQAKKKGAARRDEGTKSTVSTVNRAR